MPRPEPPAAASPAPATAVWRAGPQGLRLHLGGDWRQDQRPQLPLPTAGAGPFGVEASALLAWDTRLAAALWQLQACEPIRRAGGLALDTLPPGLRGVLALATGSEAPPEPEPRPPWLARVGLRMHLAHERLTQTLGFVGEVLLAHARALRGRTAMRGEDVVHQLQVCGPGSLPIVSLVSFLVGLILAYLGAAQLQRFGAQIYMADLVTVGMVREVAALMTAILLAGRVGAAFAAQLGSMHANEEIDALRAIGLHPIEHLVLPRVLALTLMAPLLAVYAAGVGMIAGLLVAVGIFQVEPFEYLLRSFRSLTLAHVSIGLFKATVYGLLVALAGCRQGLHAGRSAQAVGDATTASVVQAIVWIVVAASALTISFQRLGW